MTEPEDGSEATAEPDEDAAEPDEDAGEADEDSGEPDEDAAEAAAEPETHPKTTSRVRDDEHVGNVRRVARPRPAPLRSSRPEGKPSGVRRVSRPTNPNPLRAAEFEV